MVLLAVFFTVFYGFSSGTRNLPVVFMITFAVGYFFGQDRALTSRVLSVATIAGVSIALSTYYGLQFRNIGLSEYFAGSREAGPSTAPALFVDNNIYVISRLISIFPAEHDFVGMAVPLWIAVRPVPRALWPSKPDGAQVSAETYLDPTEEVTLASTFVGESFMAAGFPGIIIAGLALGALGRWWTSRTYTLHSDFGVLVYTSGFFALTISIRSLYQLPVAFLPTAAAVVFGLGSRPLIGARRVRQPRRVRQL